MAVSALAKICGTSIEVTDGKYDALIRESEQLRILKNFIRCENTYSTEYETLIKAMEANNE